VPSSPGSHSPRRETADPEDGSNMLLKNIRNDKANSITSYPKRLESSKVKQLAHAV
jgi:hypothetical protein